MRERERERVCVVLNGSASELGGNICSLGIIREGCRKKNEGKSQLTLLLFIYLFYVNIVFLYNIYYYYYLLL
jgi:hypothetical protein